ncbi:MAG: hypothetical protein V4687_13980 [Bacteroidota bacterium]
MKIQVSLFLIILILAACVGEGSSGVQIDQDEKIIVKKFSDSLQADTFKVAIINNAKTDRQLAFSITNFKGSVIYQLTLNSETLFNNYKSTLDLKKDNDKVSFLNTELSRFLDEENFMEPAVTENESADNNVPDKILYEELKNNGLNGFMYRVGPDQKVYIAWSATNGKVKTYYACCN